MPRGESPKMSSFGFFLVWFQPNPKMGGQNSWEQIQNQFLNEKKNRSWSLIDSIRESLNKVYTDISYHFDSCNHVYLIWHLFWGFDFDAYFFF